MALLQVRQPTVTAGPRVTSTSYDALFGIYTLLRNLHLDRLGYELSSPLALPPQIACVPECTFFVGFLFLATLHLLGSKPIPVASSSLVFAVAVDSASHLLVTIGTTSWLPLQTLRALPLRPCLHVGC